MNHKVNNVGQLYDDAMALYNNVVMGSAENIINDLSTSVDVLKNSWEGMDAGVQIQNVVEVHNAMTVIRNALADLAKASVGVAVYYRNIQNANKANLQDLTELSVSEKPKMADYSDNRDTINISPEAVNGKGRLDSAAGAIDGFISDCRRYYDEILGNWQAGPGRDVADNAFSEFMASSSKYKTTLTEVSQSIADALKNYSM